MLSVSEINENYGRVFFPLSSVFGSVTTSVTPAPDGTPTTPSHATVLVSAAIPRSCHPYAPMCARLCQRWPVDGDDEQRTPAIITLST